MEKNINYDAKEVAKAVYKGEAAIGMILSISTIFSVIKSNMKTLSKITAFFALFDAVNYLKKSILEIDKD